MLISGEGKYALDKQPVHGAQVELKYFDRKTSMDAKRTRRTFLNWFNSVAAACGAASLPLKASPKRAEEGEDYYEKLGVTKIINAAGTYTALTASTMPASVQAAIARAAKHPVRLAELQKAAGEYVARQLKCEAALVTSGAAA